jgi:hypothetical protein
MYRDFCGSILIDQSSFYWVYVMATATVREINFRIFVPLFLRRNVTAPQWPGCGNWAEQVPNYGRQHHMNDLTPSPNHSSHVLAFYSHCHLICGSCPEMYVCACAEIVCTCLLCARRRQKKSPSTKQLTLIRSALVHYADGNYSNWINFKLLMQHSLLYL